MMNQNQQSIENRALELLNMIHKTSGSNPRYQCNFELPVLFNTHILDLSKDNALIFGARCVLNVESVAPLKVSRRLLKPQLTSDGCFRLDPECIIQRLFGLQDLQQLLLLITPTVAARAQANEHVLHGFEVATKRHLGITIVTTKERELIAREHSAHNYSLIFCSGYIALEQLFVATPLKEQIFEVLLHKPNKAVCVWHSDTQLILHYCHCEAASGVSELSKSGLVDGTAQASPETTVGDIQEMQEMQGSQRQVAGVEQQSPQPVAVATNKKRRTTVKRLKIELPKQKAKKRPKKIEKLDNAMALTVKKQKKEPNAKRIAPQLFDQERLRFLERQWNGFGNSNSKRRGAFLTRKSL